MFIAFEGVDCCGKSTVLNRLKPMVSSNVVFTREPGGNAENEDLRTCLFKNIANIDPIAAQLIMMSMRLNQKYPSDKITISDRCVASLAYNDDFSTLLGIAEQLKVKFPDYILYFDVSPEVSVSRLKGRKVKEGYDTMQLEIIRKRIRNYSYINTYLTSFSKTRIIGIDANKPLNEVFNSVVATLNNISRSINETILIK